MRRIEEFKIKEWALREEYKDALLTTKPQRIKELIDVLDLLIDPHFHDGRIK